MARPTLTSPSPRVVVVPPRVEPPGPPRWARRMLFGGVLAVLVTLIPVLARYGLRAALEAEGEEAAAAAADPSQPGYQAVVTPTPTALVLERDEEGTLVGVALLASSGDSGGGSVLLVAVTTVLEDGTGEPAMLADIDEAGGAQAVTTALGRLFRVGFGSVISVDPARWAQTLAPVGPLSMSNPDELADADDEVIFESGEIELAPDEVGAYLAARRAGEDERARLYRHQLVWQAWLAAGSAASPGAAASSSASSNGEGTLPAMVGNLAGGPHEVLGLPVEVLDESEAELVTDGDSDLGPPLGVDPDAVRRLVAELVPLPTSYEPGDRIRVRLLDGVGEPSRALGVSTLLVPAGAEITVFGNAERFDFAETTVRYSDPAHEASARTMAAALGVGSIQLDEQGDPSVEVTVVVGRDLSAAAPASKLTVPAPVGAPTTTED